MSERQTFKDRVMQRYGNEGWRVEMFPTHCAVYMPGEYPAYQLLALWDEPSELWAWLDETLNYAVMQDA